MIASFVVMTSKRKSKSVLTKAQSAGKSDGSVAALIGDCRDYSDGFIRRTELTEAQRAEYKAAWYAAHTDTSKTFKLGQYASR